MATNIATARGAFAAPAQGSNLVGRFRVALDAYKERVRLRGELMQMSTRELADLGLSASDIPDVVAGTYRRG